MFRRLSNQYAREVDDRASPETPRRCPTAYLDRIGDVPAPAQGEGSDMPALQRPLIAQPDQDGKAQAAVDALVAELQSGWNRHDAEIA